MKSMNNLSFKNFDTIINEYDLIFFDIWGVIFEGQSTYGGVVEKINDIIGRKEVGIITNSINTSDVLISERLLKWGLNITERNIVVTAGDIARKAIFSKQDVCIDDNRIKIYYLGDSIYSYVLDGIDYVLVNDLDKADIVFLSIIENDLEETYQYSDIFR